MHLALIDRAWPIFDLPIDRSKFRTNEYMTFIDASLAVASSTDESEILMDDGKVENVRAIFLLIVHTDVDEQNIAKNTHRTSMSMACVSDYRLPVKLSVFFVKHLCTVSVIGHS